MQDADPSQPSAYATPKTSHLASQFAEKMAMPKVRVNDRPDMTELKPTNGISNPLEEDETPAATTEEGKTSIAGKSAEHPSAPILGEDTASSSYHSTVEQGIAQAMQFIGTASPEVLGGMVVGLLLVGYMLFGRLALFMAGALAGVVMHSSWETHRRRSDRSDGSFAWQAIIEKEKEVKKDLDVVQTSTRRNSANLPLGTAEAIEELTSAVVRDFVRYWYTPLLPAEDSFPNSCKEILSDTILSMYSHVSQKRATDAFITFLISTSNILIVFFRELSTALGNGGLGSPSAASIATYVEDYPSSALAQLLDQDLQKRKYRLAAEDLLQNFVERKALECSPVRTFLHEILAGMILPMTVDKFSEADWINEWIIHFLDEVVPEVVAQATPTIQLGDSIPQLGDTIQEEEEHEICETQVKSPTEEQIEKSRQKEARKSRAEEDLQQAMKEAEELTRMIEEEERRKKSGEVRREDPMTRSISSISSLSTENTMDNTTPFRSRANSNAPPVGSPGPESVKKAFTSFDQIVAPSPSPSPQPPEPRDCLHNAFVTIMDLSPLDPSTSPHIPFRSKPILEYMLQIEPHSAYGIPGWIVTRKYPEFETLHEVLVKLSIISGIEHFVIYHSDVPEWSGSTKEQLRQNLEIYLNDALREKTLAQSEGMKKFLDKEVAKENGGSMVPGGNVLSNLTKGWAKPKSFKKVGDNVLEALTKPTQGGKAFFEGVFGGVGGVRSRQNTVTRGGQQEEPRILGVYNPPKAAGEKESMAVDSDNGVPAAEPVAEPGNNGVGHDNMERKHSRDSYIDGVSEFDDWMPCAQAAPLEPENGTTGGSVRGRQGSVNGPNRGLFSAWRGPSPWRAQTHRPSMSTSDDRLMENKNGRMDHFPPPPLDTQDDFLDFSPASFRRPPLPPRPVTISAMPIAVERVPVDRLEGTHVGNGVGNGVGGGVHSPEELPSPVERPSPSPPPQTLKPQTPPPPPPPPNPTEVPATEALTTSETQIPKPSTPAPPTSPPLSEQETQFIIEIVFAILGELFTLSSAWLLRRSLLNVAKNFILRPGNGSLDATRLLIQETLLDSNTSDEAVSAHIRKLRRGVCPTPAETAKWQEKVKTKRIEWCKRKGLRSEVDEVKRQYEAEEREERRDKARRLLLDKGMPEALKGVMGQAACRECLGKVFDCLQVKSVARGVVGALVLEVVRGVCQ